MTRTLALVARVAEPRTKVVSLSAVAVGTGFAYVLFGALDLGGALLVLGSSLLIDIATTALNSFADYARGLDTAATNREPDKVIVHSGVTPGAALAVAGVSLFVAALLGGVLIFRVGWWVAGVGALGVIVGVKYNLGRRPISSTPFGEVAAGGMLGYALVQVALMVHAPNPATPVGPLLLVGVPSFLMVAAILAMNNACDHDIDREWGRRTLAVLLGPKRATRLPAILVVAGYLSTLIAPLLGMVGPSFAVATTVAGIASVALWRTSGIGRVSRTPPKRIGMRLILRVFLMYTLSVLVGLTLSIVL